MSSIGTFERYAELFRKELSEHDPLQQVVLKGHLVIEVRLLDKGRACLDCFWLASHTQAAGPPHREKLIRGSGYGRAVDQRSSRAWPGACA